MGFKQMREEAERVGATKVLTPEYVEFKKEGDEIVGRYRGRVAVKSKLSEGEYFQYLFDTDDGPVKFAMGRVTDGEAGALMEVGKVYGITYDGNVKLEGGRSVNRFGIVEVSEHLPSPGESKEDVPF